jgi:hypothetical protein
MTPRVAEPTRPSPTTTLGTAGVSRTRTGSTTRADAVLIRLQAWLWLKAKGKLDLLLYPTPELQDDTPIEDVRFSTRIRNAPNAADLKTVGEVRKRQMQRCSVSRISAKVPWSTCERHWASLNLGRLENAELTVPQPRARDRASTRSPVPPRTAQPPGYWHFGTVGWRIPARGPPSLRGDVRQLQPFASARRPAGSRRERS